MKIMNSQSSNENSISRIKKNLLKFRARRVWPSKSPQLTSAKKCWFNPSSKLYGKKNSQKYCSSISLDIFHGHFIEFNKENFSQKSVICMKPLECRWLPRDFITWKPRGYSCHSLHIVTKYSSCNVLSASHLHKKMSSWTLFTKQRNHFHYMIKRVRNIAIYKVPLWIWCV